MATKRTKPTKNGHDSNPQFRGIKLSGQTAKAGSIIIRQCGTKFKPSFNVGLGKDDPSALTPGTVEFQAESPRPRSRRLSPVRPASVRHLIN